LFVEQGSDSDEDFSSKSYKNKISNPVKVNNNIIEENSIDKNEFFNYQDIVNMINIEELVSKDSIIPKNEPLIQSPKTTTTALKQYLTAKKTKSSETGSFQHIKTHKAPIVFNNEYRSASRSSQNQSSIPVAKSGDIGATYKIKIRKTPANDFNKLNDEYYDESDNSLSDTEKINQEKLKLKMKKQIYHGLSSLDILDNKSKKKQSNAETYLIDRYKYAVHHIKQGLSVEEACNKYRISKGALLKCLSGGTAPRGKKTRLTENEENEIVKWLINNQNLKYNEAIHLVFQQVINIFQKANRPNPFNNGKPSMDWWYDFLSRHPQIMASKPDWLMRGKVNDQYIKDVQSGKLKCTKFRRALLSAIQYIRSLNDSQSSNQDKNTSSVVKMNTNEINSIDATRLNDGSLENLMVLSDDDELIEKCNKKTLLTNAFLIGSDLSKKKSNLKNSGLQKRLFGEDNIKNKNSKDYNFDDTDDEDHFVGVNENIGVFNNQKSSRLLNEMINDNSVMVHNENIVAQSNLDLSASKRLVLRVKLGQQQHHLLVPDDDEDDLKSTIDPSAFLP
jgi:hypothetical protein